MDHMIKAADYTSVSVCDHDTGVWISVHRTGAHTGIPLTREQAEQLRDALIALTETENAAQ